jgi:hypothetical protein
MFLKTPNRLPITDDCAICYGPPNDPIPYALQTSSPHKIKYEETTTWKHRNYPFEKLALSSTGAHRVSNVLFLRSFDFAMANISSTKLSSISTGPLTGNMLHRGNYTLFLPPPLHFSARCIPVT